MPKIGDVFGITNSNSDVSSLDETTDATYNFYGRAPRGTAESAAGWYIRRTTKVSPFKSELASVKYDQIWTNRAALLTYQ